MKATVTVPRFRAAGVHHHAPITRWFPTPALAAPHALGVDISDSSVKCMALTPAQRGFEVAAHGDQRLNEGIVFEGYVQDAKQLGDALRSLWDSVGAPPFAHAALPEEAAYVFGMHVPDVRDRQQVLHVIEFELEGRVPIRAGQAVFDYDIVEMHPDGVGAEIGVTVFPSELVSGYVEGFAHAGITLLSLELEARSIARAVVAADTTEVSLMTDFGRARTGIAILKKQIPIFTTTVSVGGDTMTDIIVDKLGVTESEAEAFKNEHGIIPSGDEAVHEAMVNTAASLADEITRHYQYWDTKRNEHGERVTPVARVLLAGGSSNLRGLPEYIAGRVQAPTEQVNVWRNVCDFDDYIPPIDRHHSLGYATSIGLALRNV